MKNVIALALVLMMTSAHAVNVSRGNNMGAEQAPKREETNSSVTDTNRRMNDSTATTYGAEQTTNDSISTGQAATTRRTTPTVTRCVDSSGYSYYKNDSGFASCVNQSSSRSYSK
ncbi:MAG: hypothetical protein H7177_10960 [Rhizobacter sp.]|nr:hypothetical protein [Bacteriovorax sp.]